jgi:hypothetical protein
MQHSQNADHQEWKSDLKFRAEELKYWHTANSLETRFGDCISHWPSSSSVTNKYNSKGKVVPVFLN